MPTLPWAQTRNLASRILGLAAQRLREDWHQLYAYRPLLLETFVDATQHTGSCYRAAGWECIGETKGRGRMDRHFRANQPKKRVLVYPLVKDASTVLCQRRVQPRSHLPVPSPSQASSDSCRGGQS